MSVVKQISVMFIVVLLGACAREPDERGAHSEHEAHAEAPSFERGPHRGRLLRDGTFALELAIFEAGVPPELRAWATVDGRPVSPGEVSMNVGLRRLDGAVDRIAFAPREDFLRGDREVHEPHSFDVQVDATYQGKAHRWTYASYEGRTQIAAAVAKNAGVETATAGPGTLTEALSLYGTIGPDPTRVRSVSARYPGVILSVTRRVGDPVRAGETLASVESNESLRAYPVVAPISGVITQRHAETGEQTDSGPLFEIADFRRVVADLNVFPRDRARLKPNQAVTLLLDGAAQATGTIGYISPLGDRQSQSVIARVSLDNAARQWAPGQFIEGRVKVAETPVALAVPLAALQTFRDFTVVYAQVGDSYEVRPLELGRRDAERVEVLGGLPPGARYVVQNSYLIKADIEKSGASHDH